MQIPMWFRAVPFLLVPCFAPGQDSTNHVGKLIPTYTHMQALIIAIDDKSTSGNLPLANEFKNVLTSDYGYEKKSVKVLSGTEATKDRIKTAIGKLALSAVPACTDSALIIYLGPTTVANGEAYWVPADARNASNDVAIKKTCLSTKSTWTEVSKSYFGDVLLITDGGGVERPTTFGIPRSGLRGRGVLSAFALNGVAPSSANGDTAQFHRELIKQLRENATGILPLNPWYLARDTVSAVKAPGRSARNSLLTLFSKERCFAFLPGGPGTASNQVFTRVVFKHLDIRKAMKKLFEETKMSFVVGEEVRGEVSLDEKNVPFGAALIEILHQVKATYRVDTNGLYQIIGVPRE